MGWSGSWMLGRTRPYAYAHIASRIVELNRTGSLAVQEAAEASAATPIVSAPQAWMERAATFLPRADPMIPLSGEPRQSRR